jgi:cytochrome d ubiquinol oxidase subunit II
MRGYAWWLGTGTLALIGVVSIVTPFLEPIYFDRWLNLPGSLISMIVPLVMIGLIWSFFTSLNDGKDLQPFLSALGFFVMSFIVCAVSAPLI